MPCRTRKRTNKRNNKTLHKKYKKGGFIKKVYSHAKKHHIKYITALAALAALIDLQKNSPVQSPRDVCNDPEHDDVSDNDCKNYIIPPGKKKPGNVYEE